MGMIFSSLLGSLDSLRDFFSQHLEVTHIPRQYSCCLCLQSTLRQQCIVDRSTDRTSVCGLVERISILSRAQRNNFEPFFYRIEKHKRLIRAQSLTSWEPCNG